MRCRSLVLNLSTLKMLDLPQSQKTLNSAHFHLALAGQTRQAEEHLYQVHTECLADSSGVQNKRKYLIVLA